MNKLDEQTIKFFEDQSKKIKCKYFINESRTYLSIDGFLYKENRIPFILEYRVDDKQKEIINVNVKSSENTIKEGNDMFSLKDFFYVVKYSQSI